MHFVYVAIQLLALFVFTAFISDKRKKPGMTPLIDQRATRILKASYLFPIAAYGYSLFLLRRINALDWVSLAFAVAATCLVVKGKRDLGKHHTWTGYHLVGGRRSRNGIYAVLPHPMYSGIILMISACSLVYVTRLPWYLSTAALISCAYVVVFLVVAARRESRMLNAAA
ncbi:MAG: hypothetical protein IPM94_13155 [bacterium]|nr:hypothetical protein [bacterium]